MTKIGEFIDNQYAQHPALETITAAVLALTLVGAACVGYEARQTYEDFHNNMVFENANFVNTH